MFSKTKCGLILVLVLSLTGCDRFLKSSKSDAPAEVVTIEFKDGECLKSVPAQLHKFMNDEDGLGNSVPCVQAALKSFMRLTRGSQADSYKSTELQDFFNTYLLKDNKISTEFQDDIMKLKVVIVGGASDVATRAELEKFSDFLGGVEKELSKFKGRFRILTFKADRETVSDETLNDLKAQLLSFGEFVLKNSKLMASQYQWSDFVSFLNHLHQFVGPSKDLEEAFKWLPLTESAKNVFMGESTTLLSQKDWFDSKNWIIGALTTALKFRYEIKDTPFRSPSEWTTLVAWIDEIWVIVETAPTMTNKKILDALLIDKLIDEVYRKNLVKTTLSAELIKQTYRRVLAYFVEAAPGSDPVKIKGLSDDHLRIIKAEYNIWKAGQVFINRSYSDETILTVQALRERYLKIDSQGFPAVSSEDHPEYLQAWKDFYNLFTLDHVIVFDDQMKLQIDYQNPQEKVVPFISANLLNGVRFLSRYALRGYGERNGKTIFSRRISKQRMMDLEENFREFGRAIGFFDPDKTTAGKDTFDQANLLVLHSDGDAWVDSTEMVEILSFLISGGYSVVNEIYQDAEMKSCLLPELDAFQRPWMNELCFVQKLRQNLRLKSGVYLSTLPESVRFLNGLTDAQFIEAYKYLVKVSAGPRHRTGQLESGEIRTMATILHFIEAIVVTYDKNRNSLLSRTEVADAFPRFRNLIEAEAKKKSSFASLALEDIFLYMVYYGEEPDGLLDIGLTEWKKLTGSLGEVDKLKILKLLAMMKDALANAPKK